MNSTGENWIVEYDWRQGAQLTAKDPIGFEGGSLNVYEYALGDPTNNADPTGLHIFDDPTCLYTCLERFACGPLLADCLLHGCHMGVPHELTDEERCEVIEYALDLTRRNCGWGVEYEDLYLLYLEVCEPRICLAD